MYLIECHQETAKAGRSVFEHYFPKEKEVIAAYEKLISELEKIGGKYDTERKAR